MEKNIIENISIKLTVKHNQKLLGKGDISAGDALKTVSKKEIDKTTDARHLYIYIYIYIYTKVISGISAVNYFGNKINSDLDVWLVYEYATLNFNCY